MNKIKRMLLNNYTFKITSVIIATLLWLFLYSEHHPQYRAEVNVPIQYKNLPASMRMEKSPDTIRLKFRGEPDELKEEELENVSASMDLGGLEPGKHRVTVQVENHSRARVINWNPTIEIMLRKLNAIEMPVSLRFSGTLPMNLKQGKVVIPDKIVVYGIQEELDIVANVIAEISLTDRNESFTEEVQLVAVDAFGQKIKRVNIDPDKISIEIPLEKETEKFVPVELSYRKGSGFDEDKVDYTPKQVSLYGREDDLKKISRVSTEEFDMSSCMEGGGYSSLRLKAPDGVMLDEKTVTVFCEPTKQISRHFDVNVKVINLGEGLTCRDCYVEEARDPDGSTVVKMSFVAKVIVSGRNRQVNAIGFSEIAVVADLLGMGEGMHKVKLYPSILMDVEDLELRVDPEQIKVEIVKKGDSN